MWRSTFLGAGVLVVCLWWPFTLAFSLAYNVQQRHSRSLLLMKGFGNPNKGITKQPGGTATTPSSPVYKLKSNPKTASKTASDHIPSINLDYPGLRAVYGDPPVFEVDDAFSADLCQTYIDRAQSIGKPKICVLSSYTLLQYHLVLANLTLLVTK